MNTRSKGNQNLHPFTDEIDRLQRQIRQFTKNQQLEQMVNNERGEQAFPPGEGHHAEDPHLQNPIPPPLQPQAPHPYPPPLRPHHPHPPHPPPRAEPINAGYAPRANFIPHGIAAPPIDANNFDIRSYTFNMIKDITFYGRSTEDPIKHLKDFERICNMSKTNGVSEDAVKLRLFPLTLADRAKQWEEQIPPNTITTWADCRKAFLNKFFTNARTTKIRNDISSFKQLFSETLSQAWERFGGYLISCPHHDFKKSSLLGIFYKGAIPQVQTFLDSASGGSFLNRDVEHGWDLLENAAAADVTASSEFDRQQRGGSSSDPEMQKQMKAISERLEKISNMEEKMDKILQGATLKQLHTTYLAEQAQEEVTGEFEEINYVQNQGGYNNNQWRPNNNFSSRSNNVANPEDQVYPPQPAQQQPRPYVPKPQYNNTYAPQQGYQRPTYQAPASQPYQNHQQAYQAPLPPPVQQAQPPPASQPDFNAMFQQMLQGQNALTIKVDAAHTDLQNKFEQLSARLTAVERNQSSSSTKTFGQLPGKAVQNPKEYNISAISLRSGRELFAPTKYAPISQNIENHEGEDSITKDNTENDVKIFPDVVLDNPTPPTEHRVQPTDTKNLAPPVTHHYEPKEPFPQRLKKGCAEKYKSLFAKHIQGIELKIPILDAFILIPQYLKFLKDVVKEKEQQVKCMSVDNQECNAIMHMRSKLEKLEDPGKFTIPCSFGASTFNKCLYDLGSSISLMPLSLARRLGLNNYKSCMISLVLADRSTRLAHGLLEDVPLRIGNTEVPTDFVILDMGEEPENPLLLGRPFLASAGALIDVKSGTIELNLGTHLKMTFDINDAERKPTIEGQTYSVEGLDQMTVKPLKRPRIVMVKSSKASDYRRKTPMYEEVVDGKSLASLFDCSEAENSPLEEFRKLPPLDLGPDIKLKPLGYVNGAMEYKVKGSRRPKRFAKVRQLLFHSKLQPNWSEPVEVKKVLPCGTIVVVGKKGHAVPMEGQTVKLYLVAEQERTSPPLPAPPF